MKPLVAALILAGMLSACSPPAESEDFGFVGQRILIPNDLPAFFDCLRARGQTQVAAHRGGPEAGYAENAIPTFEHTLTQAPAWLEVDVTRTRDGELVLMHDDEVDRSTTGEGRVSSLTLAELQALHLRDQDGKVLDAHPNTLAEVLDWADGRTVLELDVKRSVSYEDVAEAVSEAGAMGRVVFITYSVDGASRLHRVAPEAMIYTTINSARDVDELERRGVPLSQIVAWTGNEEPDSALNTMLAARGVEVNFGTLGDWDRRFEREGAQYAAFAETGVQLISTDTPAAAVADLDAHDGVDGYGALQCLEAQ